MLKFIYFSDLFKPLARKTAFVLIVISRLLRLLFTRKKRLQLLQLNYTQKYLFQHSYLIVRFRFKNALWFQFKHISSTTEDGCAIFSIDRIKSDKIEFIIYGWFQKKRIVLSFRPENTLISHRFHTKVERLNKQTLFIPPLNIIPQKQNLRSQQLSVKTRRLLVRFNPFTPTEFI